MKRIAIVLLFVLVTSAWADSDADEAEKVCLKKFDMTKEEFGEDHKNFEDVPEKAKCLYKCLLEELDIWSDEGIEYVKKVSTVLKIFENEPEHEATKVLQIFKECADDIPTTLEECEAAFKFSKCVSEKESAAEKAKEDNTD